MQCLQEGENISPEEVVPAARAVTTLRHRKKLRDVRGFPLPAPSIYSFITTSSLFEPAKSAFATVTLLSTQWLGDLI